jgi:hypothetical protein
MSLLNKASLVVVPSGYKAGTVYSAKPINGDGDLDFTRSNDTATRINSDGLIEKVRTNIALHSEDQTAWTEQNETSVTANAAANPLNGAVTADKVIPSATTADHYRGLTMGSMVGEITSSIYVKADGYSIIDYGVFNSTALNYPVRAVFDLSTETITQINGSISSITSVGLGWYRISVSASVASTSTMAIYHRVRSTGTSGNYAGNGTSGMLLWGAQLESGVATDYIPTTSAAVSVGMTANVPRLDYTGGGCPKLILEPQRTNLVTYSEQIDNAAWTKSNSTITANALNSPDGYVNADKLITNNAATNGQVNQTISKAASATTYTISAFAKKGEWNQTNLYISDLASFSNRLQAFFNIETGTLIQANAFGTFTAASGKIEDYGNGWYRISATVTTSTETSIVARIYTTDSVATVGDGTSGVYIYGAQLEVGSYVSSYVNTLSAASTRGADSCSKTGISSLIGQTSGTIYVDLDLQVASEFEHLFNLFDSTNTENILVYLRNTNRIRFAAVGTTNYDDEVISSGKHKVAVVYDGSNISYFRDGIKLVTRTDFAKTLTFSDFYLGNRTSADENPAAANQVLIFPTALTDTQAIELTTL